MSIFSVFIGNREHETDSPVSATERIKAARSHPVGIIVSARTRPVCVQWVRNLAARLRAEKIGVVYLDGVGKSKSDGVYRTLLETRILPRGQA